MYFGRLSNLDSVSNVVVFVFFWFGVISGMMLDPPGHPGESFWIPRTPHNGAPMQVKRRFPRFCRFYRFATEIDTKTSRADGFFSRNGFFGSPGFSLGDPGGPKNAPFFQNPSKMGGPKKESNLGSVFGGPSTGTAYPSQEPF